MKPPFSGARLRIENNFSDICPDFNIIILYLVDEFNAIYMNSQELQLAVNTGRDFANLYVNEALEDIDRTVMTLYFEHNGQYFKHYVFVLAGNRTRMTVEELGAGRYRCEAVQTSGDTSLEAEIEFEIPEFLGVDTGVDLSDVVSAINDLADRIGRS